MSYKYYNTDEKCPSIFAIYKENYFQFVCTEWGHVVEISEKEIENRLRQLKAEYRKQVALGGEEVESSRLVIKKYISLYPICYESPVVTLLVNEYLEDGIDLKQICPKWSGGRVERI